MNADPHPKIDWAEVEGILLRSLFTALTVEEMCVITRAHRTDSRGYAELHEKVIAPYLAASGTR